jgi:hypothetical protein
MCFFGFVPPVRVGCTWRCLTTQRRWPQDARKGTETRCHRSQRRFVRPHVPPPPTLSCNQHSQSFDAMPSNRDCRHTGNMAHAGCAPNPRQKRISQYRPRKQRELTESVDLCGGQAMHSWTPPRLPLGSLRLAPSKSYPRHRRIHHAPSVPQKMTS